MGFWGKEQPISPLQMTEREPTELAHQKVSDYTYAEKPFYWQRGVFRVRIYEKLGAVPIVLATPLSTEPKQAVANVTPYLSADILAKHFTHRLWEDEPMRWIEEEVRLRGKGGNKIIEREYWRVSFASFQPKRAKVGGNEVLFLTEKGRRPVSIEEMTHLFGDGWDTDSIVTLPESK